MCNYTATLRYKAIPCTGAAQAAPLVVDKKEYAREGVFKGNSGWICEPKNIGGYFSVWFERDGDLSVIARIDVKEEHLRLTPGERKFKEYDRVIITVEKEKYAKEGVHKGMNGWICDPRNIGGSWLVVFDQYGDLPDIADIVVKEEDLKLPDNKIGECNGVVLLVEKEEYAMYGAHKGMTGLILDPARDKGRWKVGFELLSDGSKNDGIYVDQHDVEFLPWLE